MLRIAIANMVPSTSTVDKLAICREDTRPCHILGKDLAQDCYMRATAATSAQSSRAQPTTQSFHHWAKSMQLFSCLRSSIASVMDLTRILGYILESWLSPFPRTSRRPKNLGKKQDRAVPGERLRSSGWRPRLRRSLRATRLGAFDLGCV